jgi:hypothetical protein
MTRSCQLAVCSFDDFGLKKNAGHNLAALGRWPAISEEMTPCAFCHAAQLASSKFATAQLVCQHLEEGRTLLRWDQSDDIFDLVLLLVSQAA